MPLSPEQAALQAQFESVPGAEAFAAWTREQMLGGRTAASVKDQVRRVMDFVKAERRGDTLHIPVSQPITFQAITDLIITWIESGYSSWVGSFTPVNGYAATSGHSTPWYADLTYWAEGKRAIITFDRADDDEGEQRGKVEVGVAEIISALSKMAVGSPAHFADFVGDNMDAGTGDTFGQYLCLGEVVYG